MAAVRLLQSHRDFLHAMAGEQVKCPAEEAADAKAYAKAMPIVRKIVEKKYPPADMKLLAKYEAAVPDRCIRLQLAAGGVEQFCFRDEADFPLRPNGYNGGCNRHIYATDEKATEIVSACLTVAAAFKKAMATKLGDYNALIDHSTTLEQVEGVWPAASALRVRLNRAVPVVLSDEVIARIRADVTPLKRAA